MYRAIFVDATKPINNALAQIVSVFKEAGWGVVQQGDENGIESGSENEVILASLPLNGKTLYVKWVVATDEITSSEPHGNYKWGLLISIARAANDNQYEWTPLFASTIFHGGNYDIIVAPHAFVILPPETQTHRFAYGTWCALLAPLLDVMPASDYIPFVFLGDRVIGAFERVFPHSTLNGAPVFLVNLPDGRLLNTFIVLHPSMGKKFILQRERVDYIAPLMVMVDTGGALSPILYSPDWFIENNPRQQTYIPTQQSVGYGDFLVPKVIYNSVRVLPCGLLPPDGAKLLSVF